jgi:hypothetical protein
MVSRRQLIVAAGVGALAFAATSFLYPKGESVEIDFERGYEDAFADGFHARERSEGKYLHWTDEESAVELRHLPTKGTIACEVRLRTLRPAGEPLPDLAFTANGVTLNRVRARPGVSAYRFELPASSSRLRLGIESGTFQAPGGERQLGVQVLGVRLALPDHLPSFEEAALWMAAAALLLLGAGVVAGAPFTVALPSSVALTGAFLYLLSLRSLRYSSYPQEIALLAATVLAAAFLLRALLNRLRWLHQTDRAVATALLSLLLLVKIGALSYPLMLSSDAAFQANRMLHFLEGNWHPTSVTQHDPPFEIPYPAALFLVTAPLAKAGVGLVRALEMMTGLFDVLVSALLMFVGWRFLDDFRGGALAGLLYQLVPMNALSFSAGNFTNLFAVAMLACTFTFLASNRVIATFAATLLALTAHFGMLIEGIVLWPLWLILSWLGPKPVKDRRALLTAAVAAAFALAAVYYLGYLELVTSQYGRALSEKSSSNVVSLVGEQLGFVFLATAALGSVSFLRMPLAAGWLAATLFFLAVDLWTGVEIRYWLQALPLLALFSGAYLSRALSRSVLGKLAAVAAVTYIAFVGLRTLLECMVVRYH